MSTLMRAARSYQAAAAASRSPREQEADVFRRATGALRAARNGARIDKVRAIADNRRLWTMVRALARDPSNRLDDDVRGKLISVAMAVQREMDSASPDFDFLIVLNENIASGLSV